MKKSDIFSLALRTIQSNMLRSGITIAIIALGMTALIGIITAIQAMNQKMTESFSAMGASGFTIRSKERNFQIGNEKNKMYVRRKKLKQEKRSNLGQPISLEQAEKFKANFSYPSQVGISCFAGNMNKVSTSVKQTTPSVNLFGIDENYLDLNGIEISNGRNFNSQEVQAGTRGCILGYDVATKLFGEEYAIAVGREVRIQNIPYRVIAVLKSRGSTFGFSRDNIAFISYRSLARNYRYTSISIGIKIPVVTRLDEAIGEAEGLFRSIRQLAVSEENNFVLEQSNSLAEKAINSIRHISVAVTIIGFITLVGAAIGLMNIMLVAVAERTNEVGLMKAVGARKAAIRFQFITEAVMISVAGAMFGILFGIALGNFFAMFLHTKFMVPWIWIIYGMVICTVVGLIAGIYPAMKAGNLNPIEALRYE